MRYEECACCPPVRKLNTKTDGRSRFFHMTEAAAPKAKRAAARKTQAPLCAAAALALILLTSCIDYVESISYQDGAYRFYYKMTTSRMLLKGAGEDPNELLGMIEAASGETASGFTQIELKQIDTDLEVGFEFSGRIDPRTADENARLLLPKKRGGQILLPVFPFIADAAATGNFSSEEFLENQLAQAMLSSSKLRVLVEKRIIPSIEGAYFEGRNESRFGIPIYDYGGAYCMEIPAAVLFQPNNWDLKQIVVRTK